VTCWATSPRLPTPGTGAADGRPWRLIIAGGRACSTSTRLTHPLITNQTGPHPAETRPRPPAGPKPSRGGDDLGERRRPGPGGRAVPADHGQPSATLAGSVDDAIRERLERDRAELNQGEDFPPVTDHRRPVRRIGGVADLSQLFPPCAHAMKAGAEIKQEAK
jgi:hypothetical protein